jgi:hypothetical protein
VQLTQFKGHIKGSIKGHIKGSIKGHIKGSIKGHITKTGRCGKENRGSKIGGCRQEAQKSQRKMARARVGGCGDEGDIQAKAGSGEGRDWGEGGDAARASGDGEVEGGAGRGSGRGRSEEAARVKGGERKERGEWRGGAW